MKGNIPGTYKDRFGQWQTVGTKTKQNLRILLFIFVCCKQKTAEYVLFFLKALNVISVALCHFFSVNF